MGTPRKELIKTKKCAFCNRTLHTHYNKTLGVCYYCEQAGKRVGFNQAELKVL